MKKVLVLTIWFIFAGMAPVLAEGYGDIAREVAVDRDLEYVSVIYPEPYKDTWEFGTEISYIEYEEPDIMKDTGIMYGVFASGAYHSGAMLKNGYMFKGEAKASWGKVDYDGQLQSGTPYTVDDIDDYMLEFRALGGYDFAMLKKFILTPYIGAGYRYLNDDTSFDPAGYERESNYFYSPVGIDLHAALNQLERGWFLCLRLEYDHLWSGLQISHLSDFNAALDDVENRQTVGFGLRGSLKLMRKIGETDFTVEPFIRYWDIEESERADVIAGGSIAGWALEPANNSTEFGTKFALTW